MATKISQSFLQVEFEVPSQIDVSVSEGIALSDVFAAFRYTNYINAIDNPHVGPIRIAKIELPGKTLYLCDRLWGSAGEECLYEDQLFEPMVLNWGNIAVGAIDPIDTTVSPATMSFAVDNNTPVGGSDSFGELFTAYDPYYAKITVTEFFDASPPTDGIKIFEGYIESANVVSGGSVQIACSGFELSISNKFDNEIVDTDTYPNADPDDIGKMLPQVYGSAERVPFRAVDIGAYSTLIADISDSATTIEVTNSENFASSGTVQIDAEKISYTGNTNNQLTGCTRAAESTTAVSHNAGTYVVKAILVEADYFFYIIGHAVKSITTVYMDNVRQDPANYTAYTGQSGNYHADYNGYACIMFKNLSSTQTMGAVSADIEGWQDDAAGSYTGTANALIESPEAIIKHILLNRCGLSASAINPSSYAVAKAAYGTIVTESVVIGSPPNVRELINRIAYEASSVEYWDAGAHNLVYLPTHTTVTKTIDANRIDAESVDVRYTDRVDLLNSLTLWYNYYWSGYSGDDAFRGTVIDSDTTSIAKYGTLEKEAFQFKYLEGAQNAERAIAWLLNELKNPRLIVSFTGGYYLTDIRRSNLINFDFEPGDALDSAFSGLVSTTDKFMVTDIVRSVGSITLEMVQLIPMAVFWEDWGAGFYGTHNWRWLDEYNGDYYDERDGTPLPPEISLSDGSVLLQPTEVGDANGNEARIMWKAARACEGQDEEAITGITTMILSGSSATSELRDPYDYGGDGPHVKIRINKTTAFHINDQTCLPLSDGDYYLSSFPSSINLAAYGITEVNQIAFYVSMQYAYEGDWAWMRIGGIRFE